MSAIVCRPKSLTTAQLALATRRSIEINPDNAAQQRSVARTPIGRRGGPRRLALLVGNRWPESGVRLSVQFLDNPPRDLRQRILLHMNAWSQTANVSFVETAETGQVRIARLDDPPDMAGYWSYVGTQILGIEDEQPTMNLEGFTTKTPDAEFRRVVRHEAGHTLGFEHEHMRSAFIKRIDRRRAIAYFDLTQGWTAEETVEQVLTPLSRASIMGTRETDPHSVMCYQIPRQITKDGKPIVGGRDITRADAAFAAKVYPIVEGARESGPQERKAFGPPEAPAPSAFPAATEPNGDTFHIVIMDRFTLDGAGAGKRLPQPEFIRVFATYAGARVTVPMRVKSSPGKAQTRFPQIIAMHERIKQYTNRSAGSLPEDDAMLAFGADLFETLFQGDVRRLYDEARSRQHGRKLDVVLTSMVPWIAEKPWEFSYDSSRNSFLATEDIHFIRNVLTAIPADTIPPLPGPLRILVASAQPAGFGRLSIDQELRVIRRGFEPLIRAGLAEVEILPRATPSGIHETLSTSRFSVVHFIGHGVFDEDAQEGALVFENGRGGEFLLGERSVREIFCQRGVTLVFLNACQTGSGGRADFNKGVAQSLVAHGLPALVANQYSVLDSSATHFAQHFYWSLAQGMSLGQAAREARIAVNYSMQGEMIDWAVPVVYARDPNMRLAYGADPQARTAATRRTSRDLAPAEEPTFRIAVWDIDNVFPALGQTLDAMNGVQQRFGFELVDLSAPVDAWDMETESPNGTPYLWAERMAERLRRAPLDLRVDLLACVTRHWMRSDDTFNLYGWWPEADGPAVAVFSCAGFDDLAPEGTETDRAIANLLVTGLAGYFGQLDSHTRGRKDCPMAFNANRNLKNIVGRQHFDPGCRAMLQKKLSRELPTLESLLNVFG